MHFNIKTRKLLQNPVVNNGGYKIMRITQEITKNILQLETEKKFGKAINELTHEVQLLLTKEVEKSIPKLDEYLISDGWIRNSNRVTFRSNGNVSEILPTYIRTRLKLSDALPIRYSAYSHEITDVPKRTLNKISKLIVLHSEKNKFEKNLKSTLQAFTSSKKLLTHLPELSIHFQEENKNKALIPMEQINEIRAQLVRPLARP